MENLMSLQQKRVSIRIQKRKQEIQSIFATKRKLLLQGQSSMLTTTLVDYLNLIAQNNQTSKNIRLLSNLLAEQHPFECFDRKGFTQSRQDVQEFSIKLCDLILNGVINLYRTESRQDINQRIVCLTVISNLLADREVDNNLLFATICAFLRQVYFSVDVWGVGKQIYEVGWLVGNLIGKQITKNSEEDTNYILQWIEELLRLEQTDMIAVMYKNLGLFISSIQQKYRINGCDFPQVHTASLINILVITIQKNISTCKPLRVLLRGVEFLNSKVYLLLGYCPKAVVEKMISKIIQMMGFISQQLCYAAIGFVRRVVGGCSLQQIAPRQRKVLESIQKIRINIAQNYFVKFMKLILLKENKAKRQLISLLQTLVNSPSQHNQYIMALLAGAGLQEVLVDLTKTGDKQLLVDIMHFITDIQHISKGKYGSQFGQKVQQQLGQFIIVNQRDPNPI